MKTLGISTASKFSGVCLADGRKMICEFTSSDTKSEDLTLLADRIFKESGADLKDVELIAVAQGPGSYSGLRGGLAAAKSLAQVLNIPIIGVSTLEAMAFNLVAVEGTIAAVMDAIRDEYNMALFSSDSKRLRRMTGDFSVPSGRITKFLSDIGGELYVVTNAEEVRINNPKIRFADEAHSMPTAANVALVGQEKIKNGRQDDILSIVPNYSHTPKLKEYIKNDI